MSTNRTIAGQRALVGNSSQSRPNILWITTEAQAVKHRLIKQSFAASVLLVERLEMLGGLGSAGCVGNFCAAEGDLAGHVALKMKLSSWILATGGGIAMRSSRCGGRNRSLPNTSGNAWAHPSSSPAPPPCSACGKANDRLALSSARTMDTCCLMGQAAGTAAVLAARNAVSLRTVDPADVRKTLQVRTYSPWYDDELTDSKNRLDLHL